jgi:hypothetical protein
VLLILLLMIVLLSVLLSPDFLLLRFLSLALLCAARRLRQRAQPRHGRRFFSTWMIFSRGPFFLAALCAGPLASVAIYLFCAALVAVCDF